MNPKHYHQNQDYKNIKENTKFNVVKDQKIIHKEKEQHAEVVAENLVQVEAIKLDKEQNEETVQDKVDKMALNNNKKNIL